MRPPSASILRLVVPWACRATCVVVLAMHGAHGGAAPPPTDRTIVDHAVVQAGGACRGCGQPHCHGCRTGQQRHHATCRAGHCHPYCPVRPQEFGFYETNWRRWPGSGVVAATNLEAVTPVTPPKSEVPTADEESATLPTTEAPIPDEGAAFRRQPSAAPSPPAEPPLPQGPLPPLQPSAQPRATPQPPPQQQPPQPRVVQPPPGPAPKAVPPPQRPAQPGPPPKPAPGPAKGKDLFDESRVQPPALRRVVVSGQPPLGTAVAPPRAIAPAAAPLQKASFELPQPPEPPPLSTPRVPFDPTSEAARIRRSNQSRR